MKITVEGPNPELITHVCASMLLPGPGIYLQVDTPDKWPRYNYGSIVEADGSRQDTITLYPQEATDGEPDDLRFCDVVLTPETEDERHILDGLSAEISSRYGPQVIFLPLCALDNDVLIGEWRGPGDCNTSSDSRT